MDRLAPPHSPHRPLPHPHAPSRAPRTACVVAALVTALAATLPTPASTDSGELVGLRTYTSANERFTLTIDPRRDGDGRAHPLLTYDDAQIGRRWVRDATGFEDFDFPLDVVISNDGRYLVFGGASTHNVSFDPDYREGLRIYRADGTLVRFVSRRDLPVGSYGISTAFWYDETRTTIEDGRLRFFTPGRDEPTVFELETGEVVSGEIVPGQGDDAHHGEWLRQQYANPVDG